MTIELDKIFRTTIDLLIGCFLDRPNLLIGIRGGAISLVLFIVVGPLPLKALVKRVELISIYTTIAFTDKGKYCLVFIKRLT
jgi:hypothetical protein